MSLLKILNINHVAIHVMDVQVNRDFYKNILLLEELPRPNFDFEGAWFKIGVAQELHLIAGRNAAVQSGSRSNHFAFETEKLKDWENHFNKNQISFRPTKKRPDGAYQLFVEDPDGHWIELYSPEYQ